MWSIDVLCAARVNRLWICTEEASVGAALESSCLRFLHGLGLEQGAWSAGPGDCSRVDALSQSQAMSRPRAC